MVLLYFPASRNTMDVMKSFHIKSIQDKKRPLVQGFYGETYRTWGFKVILGDMEGSGRLKLGTSKEDKQSLDQVGPVLAAKS